MQNTEKLHFNELSPDFKYEQEMMRQGGGMIDRGAGQQQDGGSVGNTATIH